MKAALARYGYALWIALIAAFALLHGLHLTADFPHHSRWPDWAKYTDEGWYANAAIRAHLRGHWYQPDWYERGGFNPAVAVPLWPLLMWLLFFATGVSLVAARAVAVALFCLNLVLVERLLRPRRSQPCPSNTGLPRWATLLALTLLATSPLLYAFSRLALLEPMLLTLALLALHVALGLAASRRPLRRAVLLGLLLAAMILTKTTAVALLPAILWAALFPLRTQARRLLRVLAVTGFTSLSLLALWAAAVVRLHLLGDLTYFFFINRYPQPHTLAGHLAALGWALHGALWIDPVLMPLFAVLLLTTIAGCWQGRLRALVFELLFADPLFVASLLAVAGYLGFMAAQDHSQPRYYTVVAGFAFIALAQVVTALLAQPSWSRLLGLAALIPIGCAIALNSLQTLRFVLHPQYTWITAARSLTAAIDAHPRSRRLLLATSGDQITLMTGLPAANDDFGTDLPERRIRRANPGWFATWNDLDPAILAAIHRSYALQQVAIYPALDDPQRNQLVLFRLVPRTLPPTAPHDFASLSQPLPDDRITIPVE